MKRICIINVFLSFCTLLPCQLPIGSWSDHLNYSSAIRVAGNSENIYASTGTSILSLVKEFDELKKLSPVNGLSETGISSIGWSDEQKMLIIAYTSTNLDLLKGSVISNIPDILDKNIQGNKRINRIRTKNNRAYLATGFGIVVVDLVREEIYDTWRPGPDPGNNEVFDIAFGNSRIFAATAKGVWQADESNQGLAYYGNWSAISGFPGSGSECTHLAFSGETLYCNVSDEINGDKVYSINERTELFSHSPGLTNKSFDIAPQGFTVTSSSAVRNYGTDGSLLSSTMSYPWGMPDMSQGIIIDGDLWIADRKYGLVRNENMTSFKRYAVPGPSVNFAAAITSLNGKTILCHGGTDELWNGLKREFQVSVSENYLFTSLASAGSFDAMRSLIDPYDISHFFVSSWGSGLLEFRNNKLIRHYDSSNSPFQSSGSSGGGTKVLGMAMDRSRNLWITQSGVTGSIKILKNDGTWLVHPAAIDAPVTGDIISATSGIKWILLPGGNGLFIIDDNGTPDNLSDDRTKKMMINEGNYNVITSVFSIAEDLQGNIWIGTDQGPVVYYGAVNIFNDGVTGSRLKLPRNDGSGLADYLLGTETVTAIAIDGAGRKWFGTKSSGVYLLSADNTKVISHYNAANSPLFSDSVTAVAVDSKTGEVWFGTSEGTLSLREIAIAGRDSYSDVYSFPNPVREDFSGNVTITGLMNDTEVRITDISGNLVYKTISEGGQASWDLTTYNGQRVRTGVYLVFCADTGATSSAVTKILVIGR